MEEKKTTRRSRKKQESFSSREDRIRHYETILNEAGQVLSEYEAALERFAAVQEKIAALNAYYGSKDWKKDFEASEAGQLPADLPCGVLSEDGVWNLLDRNRELIEDTKAYLEPLIKSAAAEAKE